MTDSIDKGFHGIMNLHMGIDIITNLCEGMSDTILDVCDNVHELIETIKFDDDYIDVDYYMKHQEELLEILLKLGELTKASLIQIMESFNECPLVNTQECTKEQFDLQSGSIDSLISVATNSKN